ncbi:MAG: 30S ribosomal protein S17 [Candidatus Pacebacteria bacterium]|nr:30S ribosomal protein S17 [Candidatus Paceibacterota bacterium]
MKKILEGQIVSNKMTNTVVVRVETVKVHPKYRKRYKSFKRFKADTDGKVFQIGERVAIEESRPLSKDKRWKVKQSLSDGELKAKIED